ncbi:GntR family transcriptional regulator [Actinoplanes sp. TRM 88003]|uniref:GntR family transcriptional regulator n=1 Tax=Paractinoplanes aksuensis TaxID=2939490 RepID=A0ABT1E4G6_9ACTN|nr:GntR family transcriptional regulator [Actinoplanes aksuensis]MCO8277768.1 GntR family transcriptional regulator [Actinoplanes aksuensis]
MSIPYESADNGSLSRTLLSDQAYDLVRRSILEGTLQPGARIVESEMARQLGVSQAPVREAVKRLVHEGLVVSVARRGSYVRQISEDEAADAREVRGLLEEAAARDAVLHFTGADRVILETFVGLMQESAAILDLAGFRQADMAFHRAVVLMSGNSYLPRLWDVMEPSLMSLRIVGDPGFKGDWNEMAVSHQRLIEVLADGNRGRAAAAFLNHATGIEA